MANFDVKKHFRQLYTAPTDSFAIVEVPPLRYLAIDGNGDPNTSPEYAEAVRALFSVSYAARFYCKDTLGIAHVVGPLEGLWPASIVGKTKSDWSWTMLVHQPDHVTEEIIEAAKIKAMAKQVNAAIDRLRLVTIEEGLAVQFLHIGSYDDEAPTIARMHNEYMPEQGLVPTSRHHEIYLSNPQNTPTEKLKTIVRQPVARTS